MDMGEGDLQGGDDVDRTIDMCLNLSSLTRNILCTMKQYPLHAWPYKAVPKETLGATSIGMGKEMQGSKQHSTWWLAGKAKDV